MLESFRHFCRRHRYLSARRLVQIGILMAFVSGPWWGLWLARGTLAGSQWLGLLFLTDPFVFLQSLLAGHSMSAGAISGVILVAGFYAIFGGRLFCGWVCPVNLITDAANGLRRGLGWRKASRLKLDRRLRHVILILALLGAAISGSLLWEFINPITLSLRGLIFGLWTGAIAAAAGVFLFDFFLLGNGFCGHVCPVGAFYGWMGKRGKINVSAEQRQACTNCGDCFKVCPEPHVIAPALRIGGTPNDAGPTIGHQDCLRCGRCIEVCDQNVFVYRWGQASIRNTSQGNSSACQTPWTSAKERAHDRKCGN